MKKGGFNYRLPFPAFDAIVSIAFDRWSSPFYAEISDTEWVSIYQSSLQ